jgi:RNA polymerase sigma-70 factor, ECF subfamily
MQGKTQDSFLAAAALAGDEQAFAKLYDKYGEKIFRFFAWRARSREEAQDLTAEVFLKVWQYIARDRKKVENFQALLYRIAANMLADYYRDKRSERETLMSEEQWNGLADRQYDLALVSARQDEYRRVYILLQKLPTPDRDLLLMKYAQDLSVKEIAAAMDKTTGAVRVALHRAVKALKGLLRNK